MLLKKNVLIIMGGFVIIQILFTVLYFKKVDISEKMPEKADNKVNGLEENMSESESYFNGHKLLHLRYSNLVNNTYKVDVYWFPDFSRPMEPTGPAIINFKHTKNEENSFNVSTNFFSLPRTFFAQHEIADETGKINKKKIAEKPILYTEYPTLGKEFTLNNQNYNPPPFFFKDVDFDGNQELVIVDFAAAQRFGNAYKVYKIFEGGLNPLDDVTNEQPYASFDSMTKFDYDKKTVTVHFSGGVNDSFQETYQYSPEGKHHEKNKFIRLMNNTSSILAPRDRMTEPK